LKRYLKLEFKKDINKKKSRKIARDANFEKKNIFPQPKVKKKK
jgi:hypothetical protein